MSDKDAKNYAAISAAKKQHNESCPFGGQAIELHLSPYDIDRLDWEEGEVICGLTVVANDQVNPGMMRVVCDGEIQDPGPSITEEMEKELIDRDLVSV